MSTTDFSVQSKSRFAKFVRDDSYQICNRCIMDSSDPEITFSAAGNCNHCESYYENLSSQQLSGDTGKRKVSEIVQQIKESRKDNRYDCIIGVSGGVDSTYVAYYVTKVLGLRPLAVHMDNGWNSELAVKNIERTLKTLNIDLITKVLNWNEFRELQISFLDASTPDGEIPTDHAIWATLYETAIKHNIQYIITGMNFTTEWIHPRAWSQGHRDWRYIESVHKIFSGKKLGSYPHYNLFDRIRYSKWHQLKMVNILQYIDYSKKEAMDILERELGWKYYGGKHYESIYTRFYQGYVLPVKFGFDKRRAHLSTLICSGEITREKALEEMEKSPYPSDDLLKEDYEYIKKKLGLSEERLQGIMNRQAKTFWDYPNYYNVWYYKLLKSISRAFLGK